ncbi:hypothetical protein QFC22_002210 [Naganishia vaughanmartiniae]|uniref:Uncharacterized protein n=1 Tax=Naganishia vaughanmartiniae TaxID=1424756 RepID=A0ACC2XDX5_9TREE|nr:hypothetical protein QFC22_002210 [Naganishia vaughanmartiniae]
MLENIYISRHGFRSNWVDSSITTSVTGMSRDPPLAAHGLDQAQELAKFLANPPPGEGLPVPDLVFSSPFYRCIQTASYTAKRLGMPLKLEHGVQEWYSQVLPDTGLHPRPGHAEHLKQFFPDILDEQYRSTVYASRSGESVSELQARCDLFIDAFVNRIEAEYPNVKTVAIFAHAASAKEIRAGCATTSFYRRKLPSTSNDAAQGEPGTNGTSTQPTANGTKSTVGCWDCLWNGRADYLTQGEERNWGFQDIILNAEGHVISDRGDGNPVKPGDDQPIGLAPGMEIYLTREDVYSPLKRGTAGPGQDIERAVLSMTSESSAKDTRPPALQRKASGAMIESRM